MEMSTRHVPFPLTNGFGGRHDGASMTPKGQVCDNRTAGGKGENALFTRNHTRRAGSMANLHLSWTEPDTNDGYTIALDHARRVGIARELRAKELEQALKAALADAPHWRFQASRLLNELAEGIIHEPPTITGYRHDHA
jgi:hypothetical protein